MDKKQFKKELQSLKPIEVIEHPFTQSRFVDIFTQVHGQDGEVIYEAEKFYFAKALQEDPKIGECTPLSLFSVFLDIATKGLSLDRSSKALAYITHRNVKVQTPEGTAYQKRALLDISGYGELVLRTRAGQVKYADNPEVVYNDELPNFKQVNGPAGLEIHHTINYPRPASSEIALIYVRIVRPDGSVTFGTLDADGIQRLMEYSAANNGKWVKGENGRYVNEPGEPNKLYSDLGFLKAKCLKHAFQSFPKLKLPNFSALTETESPEELGLSDQHFVPSGIVMKPEDAAIIENQKFEPDTDGTSAKIIPEPNFVEMSGKEIRENQTDKGIEIPNKQGIF